jgi:Undecaprenyl-phosphate galactose phosphotransferase WbaP
MSVATHAGILRSRRATSRAAAMIASLVACDVVAILFSVVTSVAVKMVVSRPFELSGYVRLFPLLFVFLVVYAAIGLYSGVAMEPPEEIRRATFSSAMLFLVLAAITVSWRGATHLFTWTLFLAMLLSIMLVPLTRGACRSWLGKKDWWGYPTIILGNSQTAKIILETMTQQPGLGLKAIAVIDPSAAEGEVLSVPIIRNLDSIATFVLREDFAYAIIAMPDKMSPDFVRFIERCVAPYVSHVLMISTVYEWYRTWARPKSFGNLMGIEIPQSAHSNHEISKRILDVLVSCTLLLVLFPLFVAISMAIKLSSRGPVMFGHTRIGRSGAFFTAWKFRTMHENGDGILARHLEANAEARAEWLRDRKLRNDPRVTTVGRILRRMSFDELPQLWNVLCNEMSLVGPRPIVQDEVGRYGASFDRYTRVKGGLTGLWQVSGRSDTTYEERIRLDAMYAQNWSVWLDLFILYRTIGALLFRSGAY